MKLIKPKGQYIKTDYKNITINSGLKNSHSRCIGYIKKELIYGAALLPFKCNKRM